MKCKHCEKQIDDDSKFCPSCGQKVETDEDATTLVVDKEFLDHLEFLGYEVHKLDVTATKIQRYSAINKGNRPNLIFNAISEIGVSFVSFYNINEDKIRKNYKEVLETTNRMNNQALFCSFSISNDLKSFACSALFLGEYNKKRFADFLDLFENDIQARFKAEDYLKDFS